MENAKAGRRVNVPGVDTLEVHSKMPLKSIAALAITIASFVAIPAHAGEEPLAVGECRRLAPTELLCRMEADWYAIVQLDHSVTVAVATE